MPLTGPYRTQADLVDEVLSKLGVLSTGQATDPEDSSKVIRNLDSIIRAIAQLEIVYIPDINNVPGAWFMPLADIIAGECAAEFGSTGADLAEKVGKGLGGSPSQAPIGGGAAAMSLKQMTRGRPTGEILRVEYF